MLDCYFDVTTRFRGSIREVVNQVYVDATVSMCLQQACASLRCILAYTAFFFKNAPPFNLVCACFGVERARPAHLDLTWSLLYISACGSYIPKPSTSTLFVLVVGRWTTESLSGRPLCHASTPSSTVSRSSTSPRSCPTSPR